MISLMRKSEGSRVLADLSWAQGWIVGLEQDRVRAGDTGAGRGAR